MKRAIWVSCLLVVAGSLRAQTPASSATGSIAVMNLAASADDTADAKLLGRALTEALAAQTRHRIISQSELGSVMDAATLQQLTGCDDERCITDLSGALAVDQLVTGRVGRVGAQRLIFVSLIDARQASVRARASRALDATADIRAEMRSLAKDLFAARAQEMGDRSIGDLRVAVLMDEFDEDGQALRVKAVEPCVSAEIAKTDATLVAAPQLAKLRASLDARSLSAGKIPTALDTASVDVILAGIVEYSSMSGGGGGLLKTTVFNQQAALHMQLINVDSAEALVTLELAKNHPAYSLRQSQRKAAKALCQLLRPQLSQALARRFERGHRVVIETHGPLSQKQAKELADQIVARSRASRARVRQVSAQKTTIDVTVPGADGLALALEIERAKIVGQVQSASAAKVLLTP